MVEFFDNFQGLFINDVFLFHQVMVLKIGRVIIFVHMFSGNLLAPTGALIVMMCYYRSTATFPDFEHFCQYI